MSVLGLTKFSLPACECSSKRKILVIRGGAIGDFILTLPAIAALRRQFPQAHLEVLGYPHIAQLAAGRRTRQPRPIHRSPRPGRLLRPRRPDRRRSCADYFSEFDLIVSYLYDPDDIFQTNVRLCTAAQFIAGPHRPDEQDKTHATKVYLKPLERLAIFEADSTPRLLLDATRLAAPKQSEGGTTQHALALHPGSGSEAKNWPETKWIELIQQIVATTKSDLLLVGGEAEGDRLKRLAKLVPPARCKMAQSLPLIDLAKQLLSCAGFVGHDSGITHLAAALGLPCLVLWADTIEEIWRPQGERLAILRHENGIHEITVDHVLGELNQLVLQR